MIITLKNGPRRNLCCTQWLQACLTLCEAMDCSPSGSSVHRILQARILEWVAIPSSRGSLSWLRGWTHVSGIPCFAGRFFTTESPGKPRKNLPQHSKGHIWQTHSKYYSQWWKTESFPSKIRKKKMVPILTTILQHGFGSLSFGNQRRKRNKKEIRLKKK